MHQTFSIREIIKTAWQHFKKHAWMLIGLTVIIFGVSWLFDQFQEFSFIIQLIATVVQLFIGFAFLRLVLRLVRGDHDAIRHVVKDISGRTFGNYIIATIIFTVVTFAGLLLFIVPGVIAILSLQFFSFILLDENVGPISSLKKSYHMTRGHRGKLLAFTLVLLAVNIIGIVALGVGLLVTIPLSYLAAALVYEWLRNHQGVQPSHTVETPKTETSAEVISESQE